MKRLAPVLLVFCAFSVIVSSDAEAQQPIFAELGLSKDIFYAGDYMYLYLNVGNMALDVVVDAYLSLTMPDGTVLYAPGFTPLAQPWQTQVHLPGGWESGWFHYTYYRIPSLRLPLHEPGSYTFTLWLCATGTSDQITLESNQDFRIVPCELDSWVNDNSIYSIDVRDNWVWLGLVDGVGRISEDNSLRTTWLTQDGLRMSETLLFQAFDGKLAAAGTWSAGVSIREPFGWKTILDNPLTPGYVHHVLAAQCDDENTVWLVHDGGMPLGEDGSGRQLIRVWPDGRVDDHTFSVEGAQNLCLIGDRSLCVVGRSALYLFDGSSFDCRDVQEMPSRVQAAFCDLSGNVWLGGFLYLVKYELATGLRTNCGRFEVGVYELNVTGITSDAEGNVWFVNSVPYLYIPALVKYDGDEFTCIQTNFVPTCLEVDANGRIYCGSYSGVQVYDGGMWGSHANPSPALVHGNYSFAIGMESGQAALAYETYSSFNSGYEFFDGLGWRVMAWRILPLGPRGLCRGHEGLWAWGGSTAFHSMWVWRETAEGWQSLADDAFLEPFGSLVGVLENDYAEPYLLMSDGLLKYENGTWSTLKLPNHQHSGYFEGFFLDHEDRVILFSYYVGSDFAYHDGVVYVGSPGGNWIELSDQNPLPAEPHAVGMSEAGTLYICGHHDLEGEYLYVQPAYEEEVSLYWLRNEGYDPANVSSIVFDLADRAWLMTTDRNLFGRMLMHDPNTDSFSELDELSGHLPSNMNRNMALANNMFDRSFSKYGTMWWAGSGGPKRVNLAPQARIMVDRPGDVYVSGDPVRVEVHFANYAGSIAVDWYAGLQFWDTPHIFYWVPNFETGESEWVEEETPALRGLTVPTDTSFIYDLGEIIIPEYAWDGHYKWRSGFKRAGEDEWLGVGFPSYDEFCVLRPPTP